MNKREMKKHMNYLIPKLKLALIREGDSEPVKILRPADLLPFLKPLQNASEEFFLAFHLDVGNRVIGFAEVSHGTLSSSLVHPREVFKTALLSNAHAIIVAHNHPSGSTVASENDIDTTRQLLSAGRILGVPVIDHLIVTHKQLVSMREDDESLFLDSGSCNSKRWD